MKSLMIWKHLEKWGIFLFMSKCSIYIMLSNDHILGTFRTLSRTYQNRGVPSAVAKLRQTEAAASVKISKKKEEKNLQSTLHCTCTCVISSVNPMFDHLLESSRWDDSNKRPNIGFTEERGINKHLFSAAVSALDLSSVHILQYLLKYWLHS